MGILNRFSVVLLDVNNTFMFDEDRFGPEHDYAATYRGYGGGLSPGHVRDLIGACYDRLAAHYPDPALRLLPYRAGDTAATTGG